MPDPQGLSATAERIDLSGRFPRRDGFVWLATLPALVAEADCTEAPERSPWVLLEDGVPLGPAHARHTAIARRGNGLYSHWGDGLRFSTRDNSDPNTNGRRYTLVRPPRPAVRRLEWTPDRVGRFWDAVAATPLDALSFGNTAGDALLDIVGPMLEEVLGDAGRCLDYGAGSGDFIEKLLARGWRAAAFEPSPGRAAKLARRLGERPGFLGTIDGTADDTFDAVFFLEVIEHVLEAEFDGCMARLAGLVRPGGLIVVSTPNAEHLDHASTVCPDCGQFFHRWQHVRSLSPDAVAGVFARHGFETHRLGAIDTSGDRPLFDGWRRVDETLSRLDRLLDAAATLRPQGGGNGEAPFDDRRIEDIVQAAEAFGVLLERLRALEPEGSSPTSSSDAPSDAPSDAMERVRAAGREIIDRHVLDLAAGLRDRLRRETSDALRRLPAVTHHFVTGKGTTIVYLGRKRPLA